MTYQGPGAGFANSHAPNWPLAAAEQSNVLVVGGAPARTYRSKSLPSSTAFMVTRKSVAPAGTMTECVACGVPASSAPAKADTAAPLVPICGRLGHDAAPRSPPASAAT